MKRLKLLVLFLLLSAASMAQNSMGVGTDTPNPNAVLEIVSPTGNQGILIPRYTTAQRTATTFTDNLTDTDNGLLVFDTDEGALYFWYSGQWLTMANQSLSDLLTTDNSAGGLSITDLAAPVNITDAVNKHYADSIVATVQTPTFSELLIADNDAGSQAIINVSDPTNAQDVATKNYVDTSVAGIATPTLSELLVSSNDAGSSSITNLSDPVNAQDAATKNYIDSQLGSVDTALWSYNGGDLHYTQGKVGVGTSTPLSAFQVQDRMHFFDFRVDSLGVDGRIISDNISYDGGGLLNVEDGRSSFIFMSDGNIEFLTGDSLGAGTDAFNSINTTLTLKDNRHAEFRGAVEIGQVRDSADISSGLIAYTGGSFYGYTGGEWINFGGLTFPFNATENSGSNMFDLENTGFGSVAYFNSSNPSNTNNAVNIISNSDNNGTAALYVNHDGLGPVAEFNITDVTNAEDAIAARTTGIGSAGYFEIDNGSNNGYAVDARIINGTGRAINAYTTGLGQAGRFTVDNNSNGSIAFSVNSNGTNSTAYFSNSNTGTSISTVEIQNSGTGSGLTIYNGGSSTSFGEFTSNISGDLAIGGITPSARLDVVGDTELNGNVTTTGNLTTGGAVTSNAISTAATSYTVSTTDHIIAISGGSAQSITLPDPSANLGREIILMVTSATTATHTIGTQAGNFLYQAESSPTMSMSITYGSIVSMTLRAIGTNWYVINTTLSNSP